MANTKIRLLCKWIARLGFGVAPAIIFLLLGAIPAQADDPAQVGLVVLHGDGEVIKQCVSLPGGDLTGYDVLEQAALDLNVEAQGLGVTVCRLDGEGCGFPGESCFCQCQGTPCIYWSYWRLKGNDWDYSSQGASSRPVKNGDVEGWVWGQGYMGNGAITKPPVIPFEEICVPATSTPTTTNTPLPTETPEPTATNTPQPINTPVIQSFSAAKTAIPAGESVTLSWNLSGAKAAYLQYNGVKEGVVSPGSKTVAPASTTTYTLIAENDGGKSKMELTITVNLATATPPPGNAPVKTGAASLPATTAPTATVPLPAAENSPQSAPPPAETPLFTATPAPAVMPSATPAPVLTLPPTAVPQPRVVAQVTRPTVPLPTPVAVAPLPRPISTPAASTASTSGGRLALFGLMSGVVVLFTTIPVFLLAIAGFWWLWGKK